MRRGAASPQAGGCRCNPAVLLLQLTTTYYYNYYSYYHPLANMNGWAAGAKCATDPNPNPNPNRNPNPNPNPNPNYYYYYSYYYYYYYYYQARPGFGGAAGLPGEAAPGRGGDREG